MQTDIEPTPGEWSGGSVIDLGHPGSPWRGDRLTLRIHLKQLRASVVEALQVHKDLTPVEAGAA